jgi:hypothetical protein
LVNEYGNEESGFERADPGFHFERTDRVEIQKEALNAEEESRGGFRSFMDGQKDLNWRRSEKAGARRREGGKEGQGHHFDRSVDRRQMRVGRGPSTIANAIFWRSSREFLLVSTLGPAKKIPPSHPVTVVEAFPKPDMRM